MSVFTLTISDRTAAFGEGVTAERHAIVEALHKVAQNLGSGAPLVRDIVDRNGEVIGDCSFEEDSVNT